MLLETTSTSNIVGTIDFVPFLTKYGLLMNVIVIFLAIGMVVWYLYSIKFRLKNRQRTFKDLPFKFWCKSENDMKIYHIVLNDIALVGIVLGVLVILIVCMTNYPILIDIFIWYICIPLLIGIIIYAIIQPFYSWKKFNRLRIQTQRRPISYITMARNFWGTHLFSCPEIQRNGYIYSEIKRITYDFETQTWSIEPKSA